MSEVLGSKVSDLFNTLDVVISGLFRTCMAVIKQWSNVCLELLDMFDVVVFSLFQFVTCLTLLFETLLSLGKEGGGYCTSERVIFVLILVFEALLVFGHLLVRASSLFLDIKGR